VAKDLENLVFTINIEGGQQAKAMLEKLSDAFDKVGDEAEKAGKKSDGASLAMASLASFAGNLAANAVTFLARELTQLGISLVQNVIGEAAEAELSLAKLTDAVRRAGLDTNTVTKDLDDFAGSLALVTKFTDDEIRAAEAMALSLGMSTDQIKEYFVTAADLATAKGSSLEEAVIGIAKSFHGSAGALARLLPELKDLTEEQLRAGAAVNYIRKAFGGAAIAEISTFSGALIQMQKTWGDVLETIGKPIVDMLRPALIELNAFLGSFVGSQALQEFGKGIADVLVEAGAWLLNFFWFLQGKDSVFGKLGWDTGGSVWDRLLESLEQVLALVLKLLVDFMTNPEFIAVTAKIGLEIGAAIGKGILKGLWDTIVPIKGLIESATRLGIAGEYIYSSVTGGPMSIPYDEYVRSRTAAPAKAEGIVAPSSGIPPQGANGVGSSTTNINQDVKIFTSESAEALQRHLKNAMPRFRTNVLA
jgi:hypothetical protein